MDDKAKHSRPGGRGTFTVRVALGYTLAWLSSTWIGVGLALPLWVLGFLCPLPWRPLRWSRRAQPAARGSSSLLLSCPHRADPPWTLALLLVLAGLAGWQDSLTLITLAAPWLCLRVFSRPWLEIDLITADTYLHHCVLGMSWSAKLGNLAQATGLVLDDAGLWALMPDQALPLSGPGLTAAPLNQLAQELSRRFDLPMQFSTRTRNPHLWPPVQALYTPQRSQFPPSLGEVEVEHG